MHHFRGTPSTDYGDSCSDRLGRGDQRLPGHVQDQLPDVQLCALRDEAGLVRDAVGTGNRRAVKNEMGAFFNMLLKRDHGISGVAADELINFSRMVTPIEEYGISVPKSGSDQYGSEAPGSGS